MRKIREKEEEKVGENFVGLVVLSSSSRTSNTRLFIKRIEPTRKSTVLMAEPLSPKVSCIGRVRSKKDRSRRLGNWQRSMKLSVKMAMAVAKAKMVRSKSTKHKKNVDSGITLSQYSGSVVEQIQSKEFWSRQNSHLQETASQREHRRCI